MGTMEKSGRFFSKLRSLAVRLDTERVNLEQAANHQLNEEDDDTESGAVKALHELHSEVRGLKKQVQHLVASQDDSEVRSFIKACLVLKQRTTEDIEIIKRHYEKYGYKPLKAQQKNSEVNGPVEAESWPHLKEQPESETAEDEGKDGGEGISVQILHQESETPEKMPPPVIDQMRTPQLADFGLSALHLQRVLGNSEASQEIAPPPFVALSPPPFVNMELPQPKTPKCSLVMDEDAPTPRLEDFGITEHTMSLNNDFTMDLFRKNPPRNRQTNRSEPEESAQRSPQTLSPPPACVPHGKLSNESMESPEIPIFCTLELNMNKQLVPSSGLPNSPPSLPKPNNDVTTPELPTFETPHVKKLLSTRKMGGRNQPNLTQPPVPELHHSDDNTEDWCLATPRVRMEFQAEPRTPEMPDMSSVTQDILKPRPPTLVTQSTKVGLQTRASGKKNKTRVVDHVSEREFHGLASYMKQIPISSINQAIDKINRVVEQRCRDGNLNSEAFHMADLREILAVGPQAPMYILSLVELKRLENVQGYGRDATFKILTKA